MHQVKRIRVACRRTFDGWRCSHTLPETMRIRLRGVSSYPWRKIDCHTGDSVICCLTSVHQLTGATPYL